MPWAATLRRRGKQHAPTCRTCSRPLNPNGRCTRRDCPSFFPLWAGDVGFFIRENVKQLRGAGLDLGTLTPPGKDQLPWDRSICGHPEGFRCSGELGCKTDRQATARWHAEFAPLLDALMRAARAALRRDGYLMPEYLVVLELQERGPLHVHWAFGSADRPAARAFMRHLKRLAPEYGFGTKVGWDPFRGEDRADRRGLGAYLSKLAGYVSKASKGEANGLLEVIQAVPGRRVFRASVKLTGRTRVTMRNLRLKRAAWMRWGIAMDCKSVEWIWEEERRRAEARQRELTNLRLLSLRFCEGPAPPWVGYRSLWDVQRLFASPLPSPAPPISAVGRDLTQD